MKLKLLPVFAALLCIAITPTQAASASCLDAFKAFSPIQLETNSVTWQTPYQPTAVWYTNSHCMVVGYTTGLWLYDIDQPDQPLQLATAANIVNVAVNPVDSTITFNADVEPTVHLIKADGTSSTLTTSGNTVTAVAFSPDGSRIAAASVDVYNTPDATGLFDNPRVQIWDSASVYRSSVTPIDPDEVVKGLFFSPDSRYLLTDSIHSGYGDDEVAYWNLTGEYQMWSDENLFQNIKHWTDYDRIITTVAILHGNTAVLGGIASWNDWDDFNGTGMNIWDATTQQRQQQIINSEGCCQDKDQFLSIAFNEDGSEIVSSQNDGTIKFWNVADGKQIGEYDSGLPSPQVAFSPDDRFLAITSSSEILIWDTESQKTYTSLQIAS